MTVRLNLSVDDDVPDLLTELAGSERRRGEYISALVRSVAEGRASGQLKEERLQAQIDGILVRQSKMEGRLSELEQTVRTAL